MLGDRIVEMGTLSRMAFGTHELQVRNADRQLEAGQFREAEAAYQNVLKRSPTHTSALVGFGRLLLREGRFEEGIEVWRQVIAVAPHRVGPAFQLARALHRSGRIEAAASQYQRVMALDPLHEKASLALEQLSARLAQPGPNGSASSEAPKVRERLVKSLSDGTLSSEAPIVRERRIQPASDNTLSPEALDALGRQIMGSDTVDGDKVRPFTVAVPRSNTAADYWEQLAPRDRQAISPWIKLARIYLRVGRTEEARRCFSVVLDIDPNHAEALTSYGRILSINDPDAALKHWERVAALAPKTTEPWLQLARIHVRQQRIAEAQRCFRRVLDIDASHSDALTSYGRLLSKDDPDAAVAHWTRLAALSPKKLEPWLQLARIHLRQERSEEAQRCFRRVLDIDPDHGEALAGYGRALGPNDHLAATSHFLAWSDRDAKDPTPLVELARLYRKTNDWDHAEATCRECLMRFPGNTAALTRIAQALSSNMDRIDTVLGVWRHIAEHDPRTPFPLVQRAQLLQRARRPAEAEAEYRIALARAPEDEGALFGLARLMLGQSRWDESSGLYQDLHRIAPRRTDALLGLGRCLEQLGRDGEAMTSYDKVLALDPANANGLRYRGRLLRQLGRTDEAIRAWQEICARTPHEPDAWSELVFMLATAERDTEALAALESATAALPPGPSSWVRLGMAAQAGQFNAHAIAYFEKAAAAEPHEPAHQARLGEYYLSRGIMDGAFHHLYASRELKPGDSAVARRLVSTVHTLEVLGIDHLAVSRAAPSCGEVLVPERLFDLVRQIADSEIDSYEPVPRRVILVTASLAGGGAERQVVNLLRGLSDPTHDVDLALFCVSLARRARRDFFLPLLAGTPVDIVTYDETALDSYLADPHVARYARLIRAFPADMAGPIAFWLREFSLRRPEVVHAWQDGTAVTAVVAALLAGVPRIVLGMRSVRPDNPRRRLKRYMREGYRAVLGHASVVLSNNSRAGADDYATWLGIDPASIEVVHNGIDFDQLSGSVDPERVGEVRRSLGIPQDAPLVGSVFRMSEEKRPLLWVEAAAEIARHDAQAHFVVFGDGPMRDDMGKLARHLGIGDRLHLPGPTDNIASCYKAMDVVMLTSRHEGLPNVLLEAQSLGVPVVAPDVGGIGETVWQGVTGWTVRDADATKLAERALFCLHDREWSARAREIAPSLVREHFSIDAMLRRTLEVYGLQRWPTRARSPAPRQNQSRKPATKLRLEIDLPSWAAKAAVCPTFVS